MDLYNPKYLRCTWDDSLKDKDVFYGDRISSVIADVESRRELDTCRGYSGDTDFPFNMSGTKFAFVYYDPHYDTKAAYYLQHKTIQYKSYTTGDWEDCCDEPSWYANSEYRVKPDVPKLVPYGSAAEFVEAYRKKHSIPKTSMPFMWLLRSGCTQQKSLVLSIDLDADRVMLAYSGGTTLSSYDMDEVMQLFTFLDGSPCGRQAEECAKENG